MAVTVVVETLGIRIDHYRAGRPRPAQLQCEGSARVALYDADDSQLRDGCYTRTEVDTGGLARRILTAQSSISDRCDQCVTSWAVRNIDDVWSRMHVQGRAAIVRTKSAGQDLRKGEVKLRRCAFMPQAPKSQASEATRT